MKTAVRVALTPLRIVVQLGEAYVGERAAEPEPRPEAEPAPRRPARRAPRPRPGPQRSRVPKPLDDVAIARKVETVIFRDPDVPKGSIDVNAADGVVWLRGVAKTPEMINRLEAQTLDIPEVRRVENLLHLPKTPAPTRTDTPASQRKTRRSRPSAGQRRVATATTSEQPGQRGEPLPAERAREGRGREPSPLGTGGSSS